MQNGFVRMTKQLRIIISCIALQALSWQRTRSTSQAGAQLARMLTLDALSRLATASVSPLSKAVSTNPLPHPRCGSPTRDRGPHPSSGRSYIRKAGPVVPCSDFQTPDNAALTFGSRSRPYHSSLFSFSKLRQPRKSGLDKLSGERRRRQASTRKRGSREHEQENNGEQD
jgi:hypothetical protein